MYIKNVTYFSVSVKVECLIGFDNIEENRILLDTMLLEGRRHISLCIFFSHLICYRVVYFSVWPPNNLCFSIDYKLQIKTCIIHFISTFFNLKLYVLKRNCLCFQDEVSVTRISANVGIFTIGDQPIDVSLFKKVS